MNVVIVGNSIAGIEAAIGVRNRDAAAEITIVSAEHDHPFARVSLMYLLTGQLRLEETEFHDRELYTRMRFKRVSERVIAVDAARRAVKLASGTVLMYDRLVLAVGSVARRLTWPGTYEGPGVHHMVTLDDYRALDAAAVRGKHIAVVGGGLIGVEAAEALHIRGCHVHFLIREPWYFPVALDEREAEVVAAHIRTHGVDCRTNTPVDTLERRGDKLVLGGAWGELPVDLVVGAIGVVPATAFLAGSGIALDAASGAIETADNLESTTAKGVFAAGDCANVTWIDGSRRPEQLWYTARDQGRLAARAVCGDPVVYRRGAWYNSAKFFDIEYTTAGFIPFARPKAPGADPGGWSTWYQAQGGSTQRLVCKDGIVKGFNALGTRWDHEVLLRWIAERRPLAWVLDHLGEAQFDEEFMPRFALSPNATITEGA
jgi:NADPH-dependent 2,4-dienoyl-CoA reductase/sulfur reductase-like enzyme